MGLREPRIAGIVPVSGVNRPLREILADLRLLAQAVYDRPAT